MNVWIVIYHYVRDLANSRYPGIKGLDAALFRRQLAFLRERFVIVRMEDVLEAADGGKPLPENAVLLTFDDGFIDHYTVVYPLLVAAGVQGSFFVPGRTLTGGLLDVHKVHFILAGGDVETLYGALIKEIDRHRGAEFDLPDTASLINEYAVPNRYDSGEVIFIKRMLQTVLPTRLRGLIVDKLFREVIGCSEAAFANELYMNAEQMRAMKRHGMFIGCHGQEHGWLGNMAREEYERDVDESLNALDGFGLIDKSRWVMNYPYGSYSEGVVDYIRSRGCALGLTTEVGAADLSRDSRLLLPRLDTNDFPPKSENYQKFAAEGSAL